MKDLGKKIAEHRKAKRMKQTELAKKLEAYDIHVKQTTVSAWESNMNMPSAKQLLAISEILNIYDIYTEFIGKNPINPLRNLNDEGIAKVMDYINILERTGDYNISEIIPIRAVKERKVYLNTVSAGTGSFLDSDDYTMYASADIPDIASFGLYISGDSMEPRYQNGELIWIQQTEQLEDGEIGIFYLDGNAYVKKLQNNINGTYLISLNKNYAPIPVTENSSFKIFGRVISK